MNKILLISKSTFKGVIKDKVFFGIILTAILFFAGIYLISSLTLGNDIKTLKDLGLAAIFLLSAIATIFFGCTRTSQELREKTYFLVLSRPVKTWQFLLGKFFGLLASSVLTATILQILYFIILAASKTFDFISLFQLILLIFELAIILSFSMLFALISSDIGSIMISIAIFYIGHSLVFIKTAFTPSNTFAKILINIPYYLFPNLEKFNLKNSLPYNIIPTSSQLIYPILYSALFTFILLWLCNIALKKEQE